MDLSVVLLGVLLLSSRSLQQSCSPRGGVDQNKLSAAQVLARSRQSTLACENQDASSDVREARETYIDELLAEVGLRREDEFFAILPTSAETTEMCRASYDCPDAEVTWCFYLYHPTERIEICMNSEGVLNQTDYAHSLHLHCYFRGSDEDNCDSESVDHCITVLHPDPLLRYGILACSAINKTTGCSSSSYYSISVEEFGQGSRRPVVHFENGTNRDLVVGRTNLFLCTVYILDSVFHDPPSAVWLIDEEPVGKIHESPFCFLDENCTGESAGSIRNQRVRSYEEQYTIPGCHTHQQAYSLWLWIGNATEEDSQHVYTCQGVVTLSNPVVRDVIGEQNFTFTAVLPSVEIEILEIPSKEPLEGFSEGSELEFTCRVLGGPGDWLHWVFNDVEVTSVNATSLPEAYTCPLAGMSLYSVYQPAVNLENGTVLLSVTLYACNLNTSLHQGLYKCQLNRSRQGDVTVWSAAVQIHPLMDESPEGFTKLLIGLCVCGSLVVVVLMILLSCTCFCFLLTKRLKLSSREPMQLVLSPEDGVLTMKKEKLSAQDMGAFSCFTDLMEYPREKIVFLDEVLGEGSFGRVLKARADGIIKDAPQRNIVAIKTCRENALQHEHANLWEELQLMKRLKPHPNIVNLLGYCTTVAGPLYMIIEFALHGNLREYLQECKEIVRQLHHAPRVMGSRRSLRLRSSGSSTYPALQGLEKIPLSQQSSVFSYTSQSSKASPSIAEFDFSQSVGGGFRGRCMTQDSGVFTKYDSDMSCHEYINSKGLLYMEDVSNFCHQIAYGLEHLAKLGVVHCDLASRNILISERYGLKIGDFGMARDMSSKETFRSSNCDQIPVKWSAPEVLQEHNFSHQSDIWSFGVVMWEIFSYGQQPYPGQKIGHCLDPFIKFLESGNRLSCPEGCPPQFYDLMMSCWKFYPESRPTATQLVDYLSRKDEAEGEEDSTSLADPESPTSFGQETSTIETQV